MDDGVIPRRHGRCGRVPGWRDVGVRAVEDGQRFGLGSEHLRMRIGPGNVAQEGSSFAIEHEGKVRREGNFAANADQSGEAVVLDEAVKDLPVIDTERGGNIHSAIGPPTRGVTTGSSSTPWTTALLFDNRYGHVVHATMVILA